MLKTVTVMDIEADAGSHDMIMAKPLVAVITMMTTFKKV